eukprot:tig00021127_g18869.t1
MAARFAALRANGRTRLELAFACALAAVGLLFLCGTAEAACEFGDAYGPDQLQLAAQGTFDLYPTDLTPVTSHSGTITGSERGVEALAAGSCDCKDRLDCWHEYVQARTKGKCPVAAINLIIIAQFKSGDTEESLSRTLIRFKLPGRGANDGDFGLGDFELAIKFRGPDGGWIKWRWEMYDQQKMEWVLIGDNSEIPWPKAWEWTTFTFSASNAARFVDRSGTQPSI